MAYTEIGDPFVRLVVCLFDMCDDFPQVGPVDKLPGARGNDAALYTGQFIAAGYSGHGMPRAFGWYAPFLHPILDRTG